MKRGTITLVVVGLMIAGTAIAGKGDGKDADFFPQVDRVVYETDTGQPRWLQGDLGQLPQGELGSAAAAYVKNLAPLYQLQPADELETVAINEDSLGMTHIRLHQTHQGLPVDGGDIYLHLGANGSVKTINGHLAPKIDQAPVPEVSGKLVIELFTQQMGALEVEVLEAPELVYYTTMGRGANLAWRAVVQWNDGNELFQDRIYLNAGDGKLLARHGLLYSGLYRKIYDANQSTTVPGTLMFEEGQVATDGIGGAAYENIGITYNFFNTIFGRDSYDGNGATIKASVHCTFWTGSGYTKNNAAWSDYYDQFLFGDGDGSTFSPLSYSLDVTAHELTHAVTTNTADLNYQDEPGAMNEAMSDILGSATEAWDDGGVSSNTWLLGEDVYTPGTAGDALRYMNNPTADGYSYDYYPERYTGSDDYGGVHLNSGIGNLAFYLLTDGGTHPRNKTTVTVPGIGITKAQAIFYRALAQYLTSTSDFEASRNATAQAAQDLYGTTESDAVHLAWDAVGVPGGGGGGGGGGGELENGVPVDGLSAARYEELDFFMEVPSGASNLLFEISGGSGDADLYVRFGSEPTTSSYDCRPYKNGNAEQCSFASPSTGTYYVMIRAYSAFSGLTLEGSFDSQQANQPPNANFGFSTSGLTASFSDASSDPDGSIVSWAWTFGDGASSTTRNPSHTYSSAGTYTVRLTVTDNDGDTDSHQASVTVTEPANNAPNANFSFSTSDLTASFTDASTDSDGSITGWSWTFGDGGTSSTRNPSHTYSSGGTYTVRLTVTDDDGATDSHQNSVTVTEPAGGPTELSNGVPVSNISGAKDEEVEFTMAVPADSTNLVFDMSGGSGDGDLYVKFGSAPTTSSYDCRPYKSGNTENCSFAAPSTGTYYVMIRGYSAFSGVTLEGSFTAGGGGGGGGGDDPCTDCDHHTGSLSGNGDSDVHPNGTYYYSGTGNHEGWLEGPAGTDFDLYLYKWGGSSWTEVGSGTTASSSEHISYNGASGYYYWKVKSYSGSGSYDLWLDTP